MDQDEAIGRNLARARAAMTQADLAAAMKGLGWKWSQSTVWSIERGDRPLRLAEALAVAEILDVPVDSLARTEGAEAELHVAERAHKRARAEFDESVHRYVSALVQLVQGADRVEGEGGVDASWEAWLRDELPRQTPAAMTSNARIVAGIEAPEGQRGRWTTRLLEALEADHERVMGAVDRG